MQDMLYSVCEMLYSWFCVYEQLFVIRKSIRQTLIPCMLLMVLKYWPPKKLIF